jgi:mediator of RNA polymerase II transcription subunit 24
VRVYHLASTSVHLKLVNIYRKLHQLDVNGDSVVDGKPDDPEPVTYCLQALLAIEVLLNPSSDTQMFVNELLMVQRLKVMSLGFWFWPNLLL